LTRSASSPRSTHGTLPTIAPSSVPTNASAGRWHGRRSEPCFPRPHRSHRARRADRNLVTSITAACRGDRRRFPAPGNGPVPKLLELPGTGQNGIQEPDGAIPFSSTRSGGFGFGFFSLGLGILLTSGWVERQPLLALILAHRRGAGGGGPTRTLAGRPGSRSTAASARPSLDSAVTTTGPGRRLSKW
jgi:hypothetical protein